MNEQEARSHVKKLRRFYTDAFIYAIVNLGLILIWAISGGGYFWPIWVIVGWGIGLGVHAFYLGLIPQVNAVVPFMTDEWEHNEVRRLMKFSQKDKTASAKVEVKADVKVETKPKAKAMPKVAKPKTKSTKPKTSKMKAVKKSAKSKA